MPPVARGKAEEVELRDGWSSEAPRISPCFLTLSHVISFIFYIDFILNLSSDFIIYHALSISCLRLNGSARVSGWEIEWACSSGVIARAGP